MAHVQHPTAERIVLEVDDNAVEGWVDEGWKVVDPEAVEQPESADVETPVTLTQGAETVATPAASDDPTAPADNPRTRTRKEA